MIKNFFILNVLAVLIFLVGTGLAMAADAVEYQPIAPVPIPGIADVSKEGNLTTNDYIRILYATSITIAAFLAVIKIIYGGVQYMLTDVVTSKANARKDIWGAIFGLLIVLSAVFILNTINPQLTVFTAFDNLEAPLPADPFQPLTPIETPKSEQPEDCDKETETFVVDSTFGGSAYGRCVPNEEVADDISNKARDYINSISSMTPDENGFLRMDREIYNYMYENALNGMSNEAQLELDGVCTREFAAGTNPNVTGGSAQTYDNTGDPIVYKCG